LLLGVHNVVVFALLLCVCVTGGCPLQLPQRSKISPIASTLQPLRRYRWSLFLLAAGSCYLPSTLLASQLLTNLQLTLDPLQGNSCSSMLNIIECWMVMRLHYLEQVTVEHSFMPMPHCCWAILNSRFTRWVRGALFEKGII
jgi:hypothetical protein